MSRGAPAGVCLSLPQRLRTLSSQVRPFPLLGGIRGAAARMYTRFIHGTCQTALVLHALMCLHMPAAASCLALDTIARQQGLTTFLAAAEV
jgi:hypothetical protein